jgi:hypothetical protein
MIHDCPEARAESTVLRDSFGAAAIPIYPSGQHSLYVYDTRLVALTTKLVGEFIVAVDSPTILLPYGE